MTDTDHLVRGLIKDRTREVVGFALMARTNGPHLHLAFLHARYDGLLVRSHIHTATLICIIDHVSV